MLSLFRRSLSTLTDFVVSLPDLPLRAAAAPFAPEPRRFNPLLLDSEPFLNLLGTLDRATYGPMGLEMPRWAMYDCGELPGLVAGYACPAERVPGNVRELLDVPADYEGLVPFSMAILLPQLAPRSWLCYSLASVNEVAPGSAPGRLRLLTLATLLARLDITDLWGINKWRSPNLEFLPRLGPLRLMSAYTPAHTEWKELTYRVQVGGGTAENLLMNPHPVWGVPDRFLDCDDPDALIALQERIEAGEPAWVVGAAEIAGDRTLYPVKVGRPGEEAP